MEFNLHPKLQSSAEGRLKFDFMHILYLHQHFSTQKGAAGTRSYSFAKKLISMGHKVTMLCGSYDRSNINSTNSFVNGKRECVVDGINIIQFHIPYSNNDSFIKRIKIFILFVLKTIKIVLTRDYDFIFATSTPLTVGIPAIIAKIFRRKNFIFEVRDSWPELPEKLGIIKNKFILWNLYLLEKFSYSLSSACIGLAPGIADNINRVTKNNKEVAFIPNGSDIELFNDENIKPIRPKGVDDNDLLLVYTGSFGVANNLQSVLDVAKELKHANRNDIKFCFIGSGMLEKQLIDYAKTNDLTNCIFLAPIEKVKLAQYLRGADVGLQILKNIEAFYNGTSPNKFFDYLAASKPVLCNYPGWIADIIKQKNCGVAVEPNNTKEFVKALQHLADNRHLLKDMGKNAFMVACEKFDREDLSFKFVVFLEKIYSRTLCNKQQACMK